MLRRLRANGVSLRQIGVMMGRSFHSVQRQARYLHLTLPAKPKAEKPEPPPQRRQGGRGGIAPRITLPPLPSLSEG